VKAAPGTNVSVATSYAATRVSMNYYPGQRPKVESTYLGDLCSELRGLRL
jgi:hypothetical protein